MRRMLLSGFLSLTVLALSGSAFAASSGTAASPAEDHGVVEFAFGNDAYMVGETIHIGEAMVGDVFAGGETIDVVRSVGGDLSAVGGTITIDGAVRDDVRVAGGNITINGPIGGDLLVFGGRMTLGEKASVAGDLIVYGGSVRIEGRIRGDMRVESADATLTGIVNGDGEIRAERLTFSGSIGRNAILASRIWFVGDDARIGGKLTYWQPEGERSFEGVHRGTATYDPSLALESTEKISRSTAELMLLSLTAFSMLSGALIVALMMLLTRTFFRDAAKKLQTAPTRSLLLGFLYFLLTPVVALVFCATIIGLPIGLMVIVLYAFSFVFAKPLTAIVLERWFETWYKKPLHWLVSYLLALCAFLGLKLLHFMPFIGWLAIVILVCMAFGAVSMTKYQKYLKIR